MRIVLQRVKNASVKNVETGEVCGEISRGYFLLIGFCDEDTVDKVKVGVSKVVNLRVMGDENDKMNLSLKDVQGEVLVVSQFTLYADTSNGNRPSFVKAGNAVLAKKLYEEFINGLSGEGLRVSTGSFGQYMEIDAKLDGPVTIQFEI